jgi:hypothetical protein
MLGRLAAVRGNHVEARKRFEESVDLSRQLGISRGMVWSLYFLAQHALAHGDAHRARGQFEMKPKRSWSEWWIFSSDPRSTPAWADQYPEACCLPGLLNGFLGARRRCAGGTGSRQRNGVVLIVVALARGSAPADRDYRRGLNWEPRGVPHNRCNRIPSPPWRSGW